MSDNHLVYVCNCNTTFGDYSDHIQSCPIWLCGRIKSLETDNQELSVELLEAKQRTCQAQERAYHWERCFIIAEMDKPK